MLLVSQPSNNQFLTIAEDSHHLWLSESYKYSHPPKQMTTAYKTDLFFLLNYALSLSPISILIKKIKFKPLKNAFLK
jgi:hypothetical protein